MITYATSPRLLLGIIGESRSDSTGRNDGSIRSFQGSGVVKPVVVESKIRFYVIGSTGKVGDLGKRLGRVSISWVCIKTFYLSWADKLEKLTSRNTMVSFSVNEKWKTDKVVTVISPNSYFSFTPFLASTTVGTLEYRCATEPVRGIKGINFGQAWAESIGMSVHPSID